MLHLDYRDVRPLYAQLTDKIRQQISGGVLVQGDKLPSVRELAVELSINPNTIQPGLSAAGNGGLDRHRARQGLLRLRVSCGRPPGGAEMPEHPGGNRPKASGHGLHPAGADPENRGG